MALVKCPECDREVSEDAASCPGCGYGVREHSLRLKTEASRAKTKAREKLMGVVFFVVLSLGCCWFAVFVQPDQSDQAEEATTSKTTNSRACPNAAPCLMGEDEASLVIVGVSEEVLDEYGKLLARANADGIHWSKTTQHLYEDGKVFMLPATHVTVLEEKTSAVQVRLEDGDRQGQLVWTQREFLVKR